MTIQYFSGEPWEEAFVRSKLPDQTIGFHEGSLSSMPDLTDPETTIISTFIDSKIGDAEMARFPSLKLIVTRSTGFDHIDVSAAEARGIAVANVPSYGEHTVAEFAFALLLALSRQVIDADERVRSGTFSPKGLRGFDLSGKTIGVVGCGHIGLHAIKMANGFNMRVLGFDVTRNEELARKMNFTYSTLPELFAQSDIITLHVPYNPHTHHLINKDNIGSIKKGAHLINTSRGAVIETEALVEAIKSGIIAGAALDVLEEEGELSDEMTLLRAPHPNDEHLRTILNEDHFLIQHPKVIVTPHLAFNTTEAVERIVSTATESIVSFLSGTPTNLVRSKA